MGAPHLVRVEDHYALIVAVAHHCRVQQAEHAAGVDDVERSFDWQMRRRRAPHDHFFRGAGAVGHARLPALVQLPDAPQPFFAPRQPAEVGDR